MEDAKAQFQTPNPFVFVSKFIETKTKFPNVLLRYSGFNGIGRLRYKFCGASEPQFSVLPTGIVTTCFGYSLEDLDFQEFIYGYYDTHKQAFVFDNNKINKLRKLDVREYDKCSDCFAKYNCGGDCAALKIAGHKGYMETLGNRRCLINRELAKWHLIEEVRKHECCRI